MRIRLHLAFLVVICCGGSAEVLAQRPQTPTSLNSVMIGQCADPGKIDDWIGIERRNGMVIDARPFAVNQTTGKLSFNGSSGRVAVVNMNPFVYDYKISIAQQELVSTAVTDFLKLLLPPSLGTLPGLQSGELGLASRELPADKLRQLESRLDTFSCTAATAPCAAGHAMYATFSAIRKSGFYQTTTGVRLSSAFGFLVTQDISFTNGQASTMPVEFAKHTTDLTDLRNEEAPAYTVCSNAQALNEKLHTYNFREYFDNLNKAQNEIRRVTSLANDLKDLTAEYGKDEVLKREILRCAGFNCTNQFDTYATEVLTVLGGFQRQLDSLKANGQEMQNMMVMTDQMKKKEGLFARTFSILKKFELSEATVSIKRTKLVPKQDTAVVKPGTQSGTPPSTINVGTEIPQPAIVGGPSSEGTVPPNPDTNEFTSNQLTSGLQAGTPPATPAPAPANPNPAKPDGDINEVMQFGRPRFVLSGGLVFSPLPRRTFDKVKGFALNSQGNPTGTGNADVVGYVQNSPRRLLPMVLLNSRLVDYDTASLWFSFGISGKHDGNLDIEYLLGPSLSFLNDRALVTIGAYGGQAQNLVDDLKIGDELPDTLGDAKLYRKSRIWKPGFSFSYSFSRATRKAAAAGSGSSSTPADDLKNEIRIGNIPFNLALGLAYTSLDQRTYDEIAGFARDRQGNLTNGRTLTRIVGLNSSSNYRLTPLALLHTRLTDFGSHDFYFSTGITGKKTDNDFDIEYLLGGSVNIFQRKVFLTAGTFIGKEQILGGNFFVGSAIAKTQSVTTTNRYVWKPAFSLSYDISRIIPRK